MEVKSVNNNYASFGAGKAVIDYAEVKQLGIKAVNYAENLQKTLSGKGVNFKITRDYYSKKEPDGTIVSVPTNKLIIIAKRYNKGIKQHFQNLFKTTPEVVKPISVNTRIGDSFVTNLEKEAFEAEPKMILTSCLDFLKKIYSIF